MNSSSEKDSSFLDLQSEDVQARIAQVFRYGQVGCCVNSVTHDINNYLGAMLAYAELLGLDTTLNDSSRRMVGEVMGAVKKCSELLGIFTMLARQEKPNISIADPAQIVKQVVVLRDYGLRVAQVSLECEYQESLSSIAVDTPKLMQAFVCLFMNAEEALKNEDSSQMRVKVYETEDALEYEIWNSGAPIPAADRECLYEPFFTTKAGEHLGLGLSYAKKVVELHDGTLVYDVDRGFCITLPKRSGLSESI